MKESRSTKSLPKIYTDVELNISSKKHKRTSFSLPEKMINRLNETTEYFRSSKKDLLSTLLEDEKMLEKMVEDLAEIEQPKMGKFNRHSILLSTKAHAVLDKVARKYKVKKSLIVSMIIFRLKSIMDSRLNSHKKALKILEDFKKEHATVDKKLRSRLPKDDPILWIFGYIGVYLDNTIMAINDELDNKISIDESEYC
ncbi:MAG: hypothetical protein HQ562_02570 [Candidatus Marinimicrobia bacterium]|nr:hypothetical protein [Candidatus Neomarinimicrobiota bacterium]